MTSAILYARYSTAMQSKASVEDQLRLLRQRCEREGWTIAGEFSDRAISGTVRDRPGLVASLAAIENGQAQILVAESLDRISRDQEDLAAIYKRVRFLDARIVTLAEGDVGSLHIGMGGTLSAIFLEQLAEKTRRGQIGRVEAGRIPGGISYGYRAVQEWAANGEPERGLREIDPTEAAIVLRIFNTYADGESMLALAAQLNREGVPSPRGGLWRASTIIGHRQRGNGILHNQLYRGRIVYNRQSFRKDPDTRKRLSRVNDATELVTHDVESLRIIDEDLWARVQARFEQYADKPSHQARRAKRLLSGLMTCGECGGAYIMAGQERWGCSAHRQTGTCSNGVTITNRVAEARLWTAIDQHLLHPDVIAAYLDELRIALAGARRLRMASRAVVDRRLADLEAENERLVDAIAKGAPAEAFVSRLQQIAAERAQLRIEAEDETPPIDSAIVHPGMVEHYRRSIAALHDMKDATPETRQTGRALLSRLVTRIAISPRADGRRGADMLLHGDLAALLSINGNSPTSVDAGGSDSDCMLAVVAGVGFEPTTFRL